MMKQHLLLACVLLLAPLWFPIFKFANCEAFRPRHHNDEDETSDSAYSDDSSMDDMLVGDQSRKFFASDESTPTTSSDSESEENSGSAENYLDVPVVVSGKEADEGATSEDPRQQVPIWSFKNPYLCYYIWFCLGVLLMAVYAVLLIPEEWGSHT
eukprot:37459_1